MLGLSALGGHLLRETSPRPASSWALALSAYPRHARRTAHPVIDLSLFRLPTFRTGVLAGSLFRIGVGATPFLLPLLLAARLRDESAAIGTAYLRTRRRDVHEDADTVILRRFGFRKVLTANALVASAAVAYTAVHAATPHLVIFLCCSPRAACARCSSPRCRRSRSPRSARDHSQASSIASMAQRLAQSLGVAIGPTPCRSPASRRDTPTSPPPIFRRPSSRSRCFPRYRCSSTPRSRDAARKSRGTAGAGRSRPPESGGANVALTATPRRSEVARVDPPRGTPRSAARRTDQPEMRLRARSWPRRSPRTETIDWNSSRAWLAQQAALVLDAELDQAFETEM